MTIREPNVIPNITPPVSTDASASHLPTSTTSSTSTASGTSPQPAMQSRPTGWHAAKLELDWSERGDQNRYLLQTGLPAVHAAVVNEDWEAAADLLCMEALSPCWLPPATQRAPEFKTQAAHSSRWAAALASTHPDLQHKAIVDMAIDRTGSTQIEGSGCLLGTNLLTLCLLKPAPTEFLRQVIGLAKEFAPQVIDNPDANGRTPLYIAVERGDLQQLRMLLDAKANPQVRCRFAHTDGTQAPSAYQLALPREPHELLCLMLEHALSTMPTPQKYPIAEDPLKLAVWVKRHGEAEVLALAKQFPRLRLALASYEDNTRTSLLCRALRNGESVDLDIDPCHATLSEKSPLEVAAEHGSVITFIALIKHMQKRWIGSGVEPTLRKTLLTFLLCRSEADIRLLLEQCPEYALRLHDIAYHQILLRPKDMSADTYVALARLTWPRLLDSGKSRVFVSTAAYADQRMGAVLAMLDCPLEDSFLKEMLHFAGESGNAAAWEFAADRSLDFNGRVQQLIKGDQSVIYTDMVTQVLRAGSLRGFDKLMQAGLDLQRHIDFRGGSILPLLADLDPAGLAARLAGLKFQINENLASTAKTDAGRQALRILIPNSRTD